MTAVQAREVLRGIDEGEAISLMGGTYTFKAVNAETGAYALFEVKGPGGLAAPMHHHQAEEEGFYIARGEVTIFLGSDERVLGAGGFALAPRGIPHSFRLETPDATLLLLVSPGPAHEAMFREMGSPVGTASAQGTAGGPPDLAEMGRVAAAHGTQIVGPPPTR